MCPFRTPQIPPESGGYFIELKDPTVGSKSKILPCLTNVVRKNIVCFPEESRVFVKRTLVYMSVPDTKIEAYIHFIRKGKQDMSITQVSPHYPIYVRPFEQSDIDRYELFPDDPINDIKGLLEADCWGIQFRLHNGDIIPIENTCSI